MSTETMILGIAVILVIGVWPAWPHSRSWGYVPTGIMTVLLMVFLVWATAGGRPLFKSSAGEDMRSARHEMGDSVRRVVH